MDSETNNPPMTEDYNEAESRETEKWVAMLADWDNVNPKTLKRRIRRGIPDALRPDVWLRLLDVDEIKHEIGGKPGKLALHIDELKDEIMRGVREGNNRNKTPALIEASEKCGVHLKAAYQISIDIDRLSIDDNDTEEIARLKKENHAQYPVTQDRALNVFLWYAAIDPESAGDGYLQTNGHIVKFLLAHIEKDDDACHVFYHLMQKCGMRELIDPDNFSAVESVFETAAQNHIGDIWRHMVDIMTQDGMPIQQYITALNIQSVFTVGDHNFTLIRRVVDLYMYNGWINCTCQILMAILNSIKHDIMACYSFDGWTAIKFRFKMVNPHKIIHDAHVFNTPESEIRMYKDIFEKNVNEAAIKRELYAKAGAERDAAAKAKEDAAKADADAAAAAKAKADAAAKAKEDAAKAGADDNAIP
jgi:hypothetical protein